MEIIYLVMVDNLNRMGTRTVAAFRTLEERQAWLEKVTIWQAEMANGIILTPSELGYHLAECPIR